MRKKRRIWRRENVFSKKRLVQRLFFNIWDRTFFVKVLVFINQPNIFNKVLLYRKEKFSQIQSSQESSVWFQSARKPLAFLLSLAIALISIMAFKGVLMPWWGSVTEWRNVVLRLSILSNWLHSLPNFLDFCLDLQPLFHYHWDDLPVLFRLLFFLVAQYQTFLQRRDVDRASALLRSQQGGVGQTMDPHLATNSGVHASASSLSVGKSFSSTLKRFTSNKNVEKSSPELHHWEPLRKRREMATPTRHCYF